ncbi:efflux RND transporter permease subunit [Desulfatibacillum aliphaticivorans]|uniref:efflux RND transporter permease subunit n=1 Tax=Desulfatibacillum aliphaticivorans TaxID=218208 RepID=UPI0006861B7D|nr:MMPL family transporter [Desulfatibacillum aliphaticivorans]
MSGIRSRIEHMFSRLGRWIYENPKKTLAASLVFCLFFFIQVPNLGVDTSSEAMLREKDPIRIAYNKFRDQFGRAEMMVIAVEPPEIFDPDFLEKLRDLHHALEDEIPYVREVTSLVNIRNTRGEDDSLIVEDLLEDWPENGLTMEDLRERVMSSPLYRNHIISEDGRVTALLIETEAYADAAAGGEAFDQAFDAFEDAAPVKTEDAGEKPKRYFTVEQNREVVRAVDKLLDRFRAPDFNVAATGRPVILDVFNESTLKDTRNCMIFTTFLNSFLLLLLFRRFSGVIMPLIIVLSSAFCTIGLMVMTNVPFKMTTTAIPAFLVAVGLADSVHILAVFYRRIDLGDDQEDAIAYSLGHSGLAIVMTSMTTAAGLLSFSTAELTAIAEMGIFAAFGVMLALLLTVIMLPAMLALVTVKPRPIKPSNKGMEKVLLWFADFSLRRPVSIIVISAIFLLASVGLCFTLHFSDAIVDYFPRDMQVYIDLNKIEKDLQGTVSMEVVVDTMRENGIQAPDVLMDMDQVSEEFMVYQHPELKVGKTLSIVNVVKETNQALHENNPAYYSIPKDRELVAQELLLFENSGADDLERIVDQQFSKARITVKTNWVDSVIFDDFVREWKEKLDKVFEGRASVNITGLMPVMARTIPAALYSMARSYVVAFVVITAMMILLVGDVKSGLIAMFPNLLPILMIMGIMAAFHISLNMNTLMIGSIAIGLVVDDTMHFIYNFRKYHQVTGDVDRTIRETFTGTGRALLITSLVLAAGFFVLLSGTLLHMVQFGFFTGLVILVALAADFTLAPALMILLTRGFKKS